MTAKLQVPKNINPDARDLLEKLLVRDPEQRLSDPVEIKKHPWFTGMDWNALANKEVVPPYIPPVSGSNDTSQLDPTFTSEEAVLSVTNTNEISQTLQSNFDGFTYVAPSGMD